MATIQSSKQQTDNIGLPIKKETFTKWGFISEPGMKIPLPKEFFESSEGFGGFYFSPQDINRYLKDENSVSGEPYYEF